MTRTRVLLALCGAACCATACSTLPAPVAVPAPELLDPIVARASARTSLSAEGRLLYRGEEGRLSGQIVLLASRPAKLRIEIEGPHGGVVRAAASDGEALQILDVEEDRFLVGRATAEHMAKVIPVPVVGAELVELLLGGVPLAGYPVQRSECRGPERCFVVAGPDERGLTRRIELDRQAGRLLVLELLDGAGQLFAEARFGDFSGELGLAQQVEIRFPGGPQLEIRWLDTQIDLELAATLFSLSPPPGMVPEAL